MYAIKQYEIGPAETLKYETVPDPAPGPDQVRIKVHAAGVHLLDAAIRGGTAGSHPFANPPLPMVPGREIAGVVDELGENVDPTWLGRRVVTHLGIASGGYAELAVREVEALHDIPAELEFDAAVAAIGTGRTTIGILSVAKLTADDVVVVTAAAGGIGGLLVQAAHHIGATVVAVAGGAEKVSGLDKYAPGTIALDYNDDGWAEQARLALAGRDASVVFDSVGGAAGRAAMELLGPGGRMVLYGWSSGEPTALSAADIMERGITVTTALGPIAVRLAGGLRNMETTALAEAAAGRLIPRTQLYSLAEAAAAHTALENRGTIGKVVLTP